MRAEFCYSSGNMSSVSKSAASADFVGLSEVTSAHAAAATAAAAAAAAAVAEEEEEEELELGLSLGAKKLTGGGAGRCCRILTAKDFPTLGPLASPLSSSSSVSSSSGAPNGVAGTKRLADAVGSSNQPSQMVVGWPPIRAFRMNSLVNQPKDANPDMDNDYKKSNNKDANNGCKDHDKQTASIGNSLFVKVNMDGDPIGRKVDLSAHMSYESLALALERMFRKSNAAPGVYIHGMTASMLLDGSSELALTYEDKDGDWMLVGDVPWGMFLSTVKRLRIMRTSDANGIAPRLQTSNEVGGLMRS